MTTLILVFLVATLVAVAFRDRPAIWISIAFIAAVGVPRVAVRDLFSSAGALSSIHPAVWFFLAGTVVSMIARRPKRADTTRNYAATILAIVLFGSMLAALAVRGWGEVLAYSIYYALPAAALFAVRAGMRISPDLFSPLSKTVVVVALIESSIAILQRLTQTSIFYETFYARQYWWSGEVTRSLGTLDSPLDLAALLSMALIFAVRLRRTLTSIASGAFILVGAWSTESRVGIILSVTAFVFLVLWKSRGPIVGLIASLTIAIATVVFLNSAIAAQTLDRFGDRGATSSAARSDAFQTGVELLQSSPPFGNGIGYSYQFSTAYLASSFENAYLAMAIDAGVILTVALLLAQILVLMSGPRMMSAFRLPGLFAIIWGFSYSAFLSASAFSLLAWFFLGLTSIATSIGTSGEDPKFAPLRKTDRRALS